MDGQPGNSSDFVRKLYKMLESPSDESVVRWGNDGDSFVVLENEKFTKHILPKHFKHSNFASFVRQLNKYDFHKVRHSNEDNGQSPYGSGAWEFKHPDFKMNNKDALDNIRRKAPAPRKPNQPNDVDMLVPSQQMDMMSQQLMATQAQVHALEIRYGELMNQLNLVVHETLILQKTVVNHEHVMQQIMTFLCNLDASKKRNSKSLFSANGAVQHPNGSVDASGQLLEDDNPASPLQHASKLLSETNADVMLNSRNLEQMNDVSLKINASVTTPPPDFARLVVRPTSRGPLSASSVGSMRLDSLDNLVYPVGQSNGIDPMYSEHINNIPYAAPPKQVDATEPKLPEGRKKAVVPDPGWIRPPQILLVEDDPTCRRIGSKFLYAFHCVIDSAFDGLEAVNRLNGSSKYDLVLMDIIMPNLDGVSACHLIRQFDNTPIIAMTSNIRSDDISMYFQHGMNDVLPKPFTKEGLLQMLEKHLSHLKKSSVQADAMSAPQPVQISPRVVLKEEESPTKPPVTVNNWSSPNQMPGVSPISNNVTAEYDPQTMQGQAVQHPGPYDVSALQTNLDFGVPSSIQMPSRPQPAQPSTARRRQLSDISGGDDANNAAKRQQMYAPQLQQMMNSLPQHPR